MTTEARMADDRLTEESLMEARVRGIAAQATAVLLLIAVLPLPHGYYSLLRYVVCTMGFWGVVIGLRGKRYGWVVVMGGLSVLFNPISPVHLSKGVWVILDLLAAAIMDRAVWPLFVGTTLLVANPPYPQEGDTNDR